MMSMENCNCLVNLKQRGTSQAQLDVQRQRKLEQHFPIRETQKQVIYLTSPDTDYHSLRSFGIENYTTGNCLFYFSSKKVHSLVL